MNIYHHVKIIHLASISTTWISKQWRPSYIDFMTLAGNQCPTRTRRHISTLFASEDLIVNLYFVDIIFFQKYSELFTSIVKWFQYNKIKKINKYQKLILSALKKPILIVLSQNTCKWNFKTSFKVATSPNSFIRFSCIISLYTITLFVVSYFYLSISMLNKINIKILSLPPTK